MAYLNNIYGNAAFVGCLAGMIEGRTIKSATAGDYTTLRACAVAAAIDVDALITFDALVTTGSNITQLAITTNTIAANEQWRAGLLQAICHAVWSGRQPISSTVAGASTVTATAIFTLWTAALADLVTP